MSRHRKAGPHTGTVQPFKLCTSHDRLTVVHGCRVRTLALREASAPPQGRPSNWTCTYGPTPPLPLHWHISLRSLVQGSMPLHGPPRPQPASSSPPVDLQLLMMKAPLGGRCGVYHGLVQEVPVEYLSCARGLRAGLLRCWGHVLAIALLAGFEWSGVRKMQSRCSLTCKWWQMTDVWIGHTHSCVCCTCSYKRVVGEPTAWRNESAHTHRNPIQPLAASHNCSHPRTASLQKTTQPLTTPHIHVPLGDQHWLCRTITIAQTLHT